MNKTKIILTIAVLALAAFFYFNTKNKAEENIAIIAKVKKGTFISEVITSGEAQSTSLTKINGPSNLRKFRLRDIKIQDLVTEGTVVKKGDYVGRLDPSGVNEKILDARLNLETAESKFTQQQLDTTLSLKQERTSLKDMLFSIEETKLELKQSIYEPPATIKKLENSVEKMKRNILEKEGNYDIKQRQAKAKMVEVGNEVSKIKAKLKALVDLQKSFTIYSKTDGMITYIRTWNGTKKKVGSSISPWDPSIASLPDLTKMESKTYANEVDIRQIKEGLTVKVGFDAFPDIVLNGVITDVANVGEKKRGSDIKVFQVLVKLEDVNENIRPGMTTSNRILTHTEKEVLIVPLEAIYTKDSITYVYHKIGNIITKKQVKLGVFNNDEVIITEGLKDKDEVYLNKPNGQDDIAIALLTKTK